VTDRPTRATVAGRAYLDLQNLARRSKRPTDELHQIYALEGFLARLVESDYAERLVLKGGVLLAALDARRPTRDVDLQGRQVSNDVDQVLAMVRAIASVPLDDGLALDTGSATAEIIRDQDQYSGVRVTLTGRLAAAHLTFHVDINVGDPIWPAPQTVTMPRLLDGTIRVIGYPLAMVHAEKLVTAVQRGAANTRWRDFFDIYALSRRHDIDGEELTIATRRVAEHRAARLTALGDVLVDYATQSQRRWITWLRKQGMTDQVPSEFGLVLRAIGEFADPALLGKATNLTWNAARLAWESAGKGAPTNDHRRPLGS
jgi:predicted nucleotidyltransferase component of viral defense system